MAGIGHSFQQQQRAAGWPFHNSPVSFANCGRTKRVELEATWQLGPTYTVAIFSVLLCATGASSRTRDQLLFHMLQRMIGNDSDVSAVEAGVDGRMRILKERRGRLLGPGKAHPAVEVQFALMNPLDRIFRIFGRTPQSGMHDCRRQAPKMPLCLLCVGRAVVEPKFVIVVAMGRCAVTAVGSRHVWEGPRHLYRKVERPVVAH